MASTLVSSAAFKLWLGSSRYVHKRLTDALTDMIQIFGYKDPATPIGYNIKTNVQQLISSLMTVGAFVGSLLAGSMAVYLGRKNCIRVACVLCCASNGIMQGTTSVGGLYAGRLLIGIANGFFMTFGQL